MGAGSGSVAIEAASLVAPGPAVAIEQDSADYHLIVANMQAFGVTNVKPVFGTAPPPAWSIALLVPFPFIVWGADELRRAVRRRRAG